MTAGLILAAGESRRMGTPKALLPYRGETFLNRLISLFAVHCSPVIVVMGAGAAGIRAATTRPATFVVNADWPNGQTSSLQCGLAAVPSDAAGVLLTLVDHPAVDALTIERLLDVGGTGDVACPGQAQPAPLLRIPRYHSRRGHPIFFSRALIPEFLALAPGATAKDVVHAHAADTDFLDLDDPGILADIDDPAAYRALTEAAL